MGCGVTGANGQTVLQMELKVGIVFAINLHQCLEDDNAWEKTHSKQLVSSVKVCCEF